jgi:RHS repeat-associated protein
MNEPQKPGNNQPAKKASPENENSAQSGNAKQSSLATSQEAPISLPTGGGAIRSMGETFQANPVTGTASLSVPVKVSPGRSGFTPQLNLSYDSGNGNGIVGLGWGIGLPSITRRTSKGIPQYNDLAESDTFLLSGAEDLVPFLEEHNGQWQPVKFQKNGHDVTRYRPRTEGMFARIERWRNPVSGISHWRTTTKDNINSIYGESASCRVASAEDPAKVYKWLLEKTYDDKGNIIFYEYKAEDHTNVPASLHEEHRQGTTMVNRYPKRIRYGNTIPFTPENSTFFHTTDWHFEVVLDYGEHGEINDPTYAETLPWQHRHDAFSTYTAGFEIRTHRLCRRILIYHRFTELNTTPTAPYRVCATELQYDLQATYTMLQAVQYRYFEAGKNPETFPPVSFSYTQAVLDPTVHEANEQITQSLPGGVDTVTTQWTDLYGEGLPGILYEDAGAWWYQRNKGDKRYYRYDPTAVNTSPDLVMSPYLPVTPKPATMGTGLRVRLDDLNSDGLTELHVLINGNNGYYEQDPVDGWKNFRAFSSMPSVDWNDPNLRMIDLTGDGFADILITEENCFTWYAAAVREGVNEGYTAARKVTQALDEKYGPAVVFEDDEQVIYLADMSGDGLTDIVRIRNGSIGYWPNLGYGRFGELVRMDDAPYLDHPDLFDRRRVYLADIDGTGTADLVYFSDDAVEYWPNQSGNSWGKKVSIQQRFPVDNLSQLSVTDLFGNGTACLVSASALPGNGTQTLRYIDLMGSQKPFLLIEVDNNMGGLTRFQYAPSTKFYLQDERAGRPWVTRLPFPVHVLERAEVYDQITGQRFSTRYAYHHGYYDGLEREFRGFGAVDQWDTEEFDILQANTLFAGNNLNEQAGDYVAPVLTKSWFHVGHFTDSERIHSAYRHEYYKGDSQAHDVPEFQFIGDMTFDKLSADEQREALRAMRGSLLRKEIYADDQQPASVHPYQVVESGYTVRCLQPRAGNEHAVFFTHERELLTLDYERNPADPRMGHAITLQVDAYGNVVASAAVGYPRRTPAYPEQAAFIITLSENTHANVPNNTAFYRLGIPVATKLFEITGLPLPLNDIYSVPEIQNLLATAAEIPFEALPSFSTPQKRLVSHTRITYYSADLLSELPPGEVAFHGLPYRQYALALTPGLVTEVYGTRVNPALLTGAEGRYTETSEGYWQPSTRKVFDTAHFYLPVQHIDAFDVALTVGYDAYSLLPQSVEDAAGNRTEAINDYRVLQPWQQKDPNQNRSQVAFDVRCMVIAMAAMGKAGETDVTKMGDTLADPSSRMEYELFNWINHRRPNVAHTYSREKHGAANTRFRERYVYTGGLGQEVLTKEQAEPGLAFTRDATGELILDGTGQPLLAHTDDRWAGTGRAVLNNKGGVVRQYEPYFSSTPAYEDEQELREFGVTAELFYDPVGRAIKTLHPDGTLERVIHAVWQQVRYDRQDTVLESRWYLDRNSPDPTGPEPTEANQRAAWLSVQHANTPQVVHHDVQIRPFLSIDDNGSLGQYETRNRYDINGNIMSVTDARGRIITTHRYDLLNNRLYTRNLDAGERWLLGNAGNNPMRGWDSRGQASRNVFDALQRPKGNYVKQGNAPEIRVTYLIYGDEVNNPEVNNLRSQVYQVYDSAGLTESTTFDFKGNLVGGLRQFSLRYDITPDWTILETAPDKAAAAASLLNPETFTQQASFDALNRVTAITLPDNSVVTPSYNKAGLLEGVAANLRGTAASTAFVTNIDYNARGQREKIVYGNGSQTRYTYDAATFRITRLLTTRNSGADILQDLNYIFDAVGNITEQHDNAQQTVFFNNAQVSPHGKYTYDALYRLLRADGRELIGLNAASGPADTGLNPLPENTQALRRYTQQYEYDELGNILKMIHQAAGGNWTRYYHYNFAQHNALTSTSNNGTAPSTPHYTYDAHGNITAMPHLASVSWDFTDRLQRVDLGGGGTAYYVYDMSGARVRKVIERNGGIKEDRLYLGECEVFRRTTNGAPELERQSLHVMDDERRIARVDTLLVENGAALAQPTQTQRYQLDNHLGSATLELDHAAAMISYEEYHPFGTSSYRSGRNNAETAQKHYRYAAKERDEETGLYYYGARYYAAWLARFVSVDPLKDNYPFYTPYQYAGNKPINSIDLDGLEEANKVDQSKNTPQDTTMPPPDKRFQSVAEAVMNKYKGAQGVNVGVRTINQDGTFYGQITIESRGTSQSFYFDSKKGFQDQQGKAIDATEVLNRINNVSLDAVSPPAPKAVSGVLGASAVSTYDGTLRGRYMDAVEQKVKVNLELFSETKTVAEETAVMEKAVQDRNNLKTQVRKKLSPGGREVTKAFEQDAKYTPENLKKMYGPGGEKNANLEGRALRKRIVTASGSPNTTLRTVSKVTKVAGWIGLVVGAALSIKDIAEDPSAENIGEETGAFAGGLLGSTIGTALMVAGGVALLALFGVATGGWGIVALGLIGGGLGGYFGGKYSGEAGRAVGGWFGSGTFTF